jgi:DNA (cytosine-5)-methyltransferase 1
LLVGKALIVIAPDGNYIESKRATQQDVVKLIENLSTAKNVQKCLDPNKPAGAQLSIPDDLIHWDEDRVLTVREMARIQSFPDWFVFRSKETTGGSARAYEVPQYTQVGNAVPPLLAHAFGKSIRNFLGKIAG